MLKKVIPIVISLCLIFSISVMAENQNTVGNETIPEASGQTPQGERGNMGMPPMGNMQNRGQRPAGNFTPPQNDGASNMENITQNIPVAESNAENSSAIPEENSQNTENPQFEGRMPGGLGGFPDNMQNNNQQPQEEQPTGFLGFVKTYSTPITSVILLILAFFFVIFYRRKNY